MTKKTTKSNVILMSFGFKYGMPNANYYFDVGFLKNPARQKDWHFFSEPCDEMREFVLKEKSARGFLERVEPLIVFLSKVDQNQVFAFGCNAGRHRSSILVDELGKRLAKKGIKVKIYHRDNNLGEDF